MNVTQENVDALNAIVRIQFTPADYQPKIDEQLRDYAKKVQMPGFRPGKVPAGMVKKMYGKSILVDELNKLTSDTLFNYIREQQLDVLGNPLPKAENDDALDLDNPGEINLSFEVGIAPKFELDLSTNHRFNHYKVKLDDSYVSDIIEDYRKRLGELTETETSAEGDQIHGVMAELNADGSEKEGGIHKHVTIQFEDLKEGDQQAAFTGLSKGAEITVDVKKAIVNPTVIGAILSISKEEAEAIENTFRFTVEWVKRGSLAEVNQDFFDKLLGPGVISSEEELRARITEDGEARYRKDADNRLFNEAVEHLVNTTRFDLPDDFLKRWLVAQNEGKVNPADIESNYENYAKGIRWQLIEGKIIKDNNIAVTSEQVVESFTEDFLAYMGAPGTQDETLRGRAREIAQGMMKNEQEVNKVYDRLYNEAMTTLFLASFDVHTVELPFEAWVEQLNKPLN
ncbi:MAG: trigger factor [Bacteroidota bacterium]|jgi:trigger factor